MEESLNKYFSTVYAEETLENIEDPRLMFNGKHMLDEVGLSTEGIMKKLQELNSERSPS